MNKKIIALLVIVCLISLLAGLLAGLFIGKNVNSENEELALCKAELEKIYSPLPEEIHSVFGEIIEKQEGFLVVKGQVPISQFHIDDQVQTEAVEMKVNLTDETKIFSIKMIKEPSDLEPDESPADLFQETILSVDDLEVGGRVNAVAGQNIKGEKEFTAIQIEYIQ
jgi:hypothetical protein